MPGPLEVIKRTDGKLHPYCFMYFLSFFLNNHSPFLNNLHSSLAQFMLQSRSQGLSSYRPHVQNVILLIKLFKFTCKIVVFMLSLRAFTLLRACKSVVLLIKLLNAHAKVTDYAEQCFSICVFCMFLSKRKFCTIILIRFERY